MNEFKIINAPCEPSKKFRRRKIYNQKTHIVVSPITGLKCELTETHYKNIISLKSTPHI
jgi:hypothetical protein